MDLATLLRFEEQTFAVKLSTTVTFAKKKKVVNTFPSPQYLLFPGISFYSSV